MEKDIQFLNVMGEQIDEVEEVREFIYYVYSWSPLLQEDLAKLSADQILEQQSGNGYWTRVR